MELWASNASHFELRSDASGPALGAGGAMDQGAEADDRDFRLVDGTVAIFFIRRFNDLTFQRITRR